MRRVLRVVLLAAAFAIGTAIAGWWSVPTLGGAWGIIARRERGAGWTAALAAGVAWTSLLLWAAVRGPVAVLAAQVGGLVGAPGFVMALVPVGLRGAALLGAGALAGVATAAVVAKVATRPRGHRLRPVIWFRGRG